MVSRGDGVGRDAAGKSSWEVLRLLEAKTREACVPAMARNGFPTDVDPQVVSEASDEAEVELLVAHEVALREFARREIAGRSDDPLALIEALPHMN